MRGADHTWAACDRCREQVSLELDGELSEVERAMLRVHLERCAGCRAYWERVGAVVRLLRAASLEPPQRAPVVTRRLPGFAMRLQAASAAVLAFAVVGLGSQLVALSPAGSEAGDQVFRYPTRYQLDEEQAQLAVAVAGPLNTSAGPEEIR
jgi:anti-sigma factor RsiW